MINRRLLMLGALAGTSARGQGFAGLGRRTEGFTLPSADQPITFPQDHAPHPDYRIEWWYLTAPLIFTDGSPLGIQWTLFRSALSPGAPLEGAPFLTPQAWLGHAALTLPDRHLSAERYARGGTGQAGATGTPFRAWIDEWQLAGPTPDRLTLEAGSPDFRFQLTLQATGPIIRHGTGGYSRKSAAGQASYYYSQPFYEANGVVDLGLGPREVAGSGWLDREWSSQPLGRDQTGWDWFSLEFEDGRRLMVFRLRGRADFVSGTMIDPLGNSYHLSGSDLRLIPGERRAGVPVNWQIQCPREGLQIKISALNPNCWMNTRINYWEGPVFFSGSDAGRGYLEMTGYES